MYELVKFLSFIESIEAMLR